MNGFAVSMIVLSAVVSFAVGYVIGKREARESRMAADAVARVVESWAADLASRDAIWHTGEEYPHEPGQYIVIEQGEHFKWLGPRVCFRRWTGGVWEGQGDISWPPVIYWTEDPVKGK